MLMLALPYPHLCRAYLCVRVGNTQTAAAAVRSVTTMFNHDTTAVSKTIYEKTKTKKQRLLALDAIAAGAIRRAHMNEAFAFHNLWPQAANAPPGVRELA